MDGLLCPRLAAFVRMTRKWKAKFQKKLENTADFCPICGCQSDRGNLCQACFLSSFRPIAYSRNIKVIEHNKFFYRQRKNGCRGKRAEGTSFREVEGNMKRDNLKIVSPSTKIAKDQICTPKDGISGKHHLETGLIYQGHPHTSTPQNPTICNVQQCTVEPLPCELAKSIPKYTSTIDSNCNHNTETTEDARSPSNEIFCESKTCTVSAKPTADTNAAPVLSQDVTQVMERPMTETLGTECCKAMRKTSTIETLGGIALGKQLKLNAVADLLEVAFKTNAILNELFQFLKSAGKIERSSDDLKGDGRFCNAPQRKISIHSFFFPIRQIGISCRKPQELAEYDFRNGHQGDHMGEADLSMLVPRGSNDAVSHKQPSYQSSNHRSGLIARKFHSEHYKLRQSCSIDFEEIKEWESPDAKSGFGLGHGLDAGCLLGTSVQQPSLPSPSGKSLLDLVFALNSPYNKPSLLPLPECQQDLISLTSPKQSKSNMVSKSCWFPNADSQTASTSHDMGILHDAFIDQLACLSVQLAKSSTSFGHTWQTSFLAELVEHFQTACSIVSSIVGDMLNQAVPSAEKLDGLKVRVSMEVSPTATRQFDMPAASLRLVGCL